MGANESRFQPESPLVSLLTRWGTESPRLVACLWLLAAVVAIPGVLLVRLETNASSLLNRSDEAWRFYQQSMELFGGDEIVVVAFRAEQPFSPLTLASIRDVSRRLEEIAGIRRVDSLSTVPVVRVAPDASVDLSPALDPHRMLSLEEAERVRGVTRGDRILPRSLVSDDGYVFAVNLILERNVSDQALLMAEIEEVVRPYSVWMSGVPVFETSVGPQTRKEILLFVPITLALIVVIMTTLFRSVFVVLIPISCGAVGTLVVLSAMGIIGEPLTIVGILLPSILLALGCAYVMHVLTAVAECQSFEDRRQSVVAIGPAIALSGFTTMLGFLAMAIVEIEAIRGIGVYGSVGVFVVTIASLTLAPALIELRVKAVRSTGVSDRLRRWGGQGLVLGVSRWRHTIVGVWVVLAFLAAFGVSRLKVETDGTRWWSQGTKVRDDYEAIRERLSGISPMNVIVSARGDRFVTNPDVLSKVDALSAYLAGLEGVGKSISVADPLRQLHDGLASDHGSPFPDSESLVDQYLLLLESAEYLGDLVSGDRRSTNVLLRVDNNGSEHLLSIGRAAESWWEQFGSGDFEARATGIMFEFARSEDAIARGQIAGLGLAFAAVLGTLFMLFREPAVVLAGLVPNVIPLIVVFGGLGLAGLPLDAGTACLGSLAIGIAVDDTIHVLLTFRRNKLLGGAVAEALAATYHEVLPALVYTTLAVSVGFGVISLSEFSLTRNLGWVTAVVVALCLFADLTLLPALLMVREGVRAR
ncbi:MAG: efflux RND transporter permease subunit [Myxococcota bacterium]